MIVKLLSYYFLSIALTCVLQARKFTNKSGKVIEATILDVQGEKVKLQIKRKKFTIPIDSLSDSDQEFLKAWEKPAIPDAPAKPKLKPKSSKFGISTAPGEKIYQSPKGKYDNGNYTVFVPKSYDGTEEVPLIISGHGANQTGAKEIGRWKSLSEKHGFIIVCPSYANATSIGKATDKESRALLKDVLLKINDAFQIDKSKVMHTGFSGGGYATWYSMEHHDEFTHLCFRCANFHKNVPDRIKNYRKWKGRPIYWFWGEKDHPTVLKEIDGALAFLTKKVKCDLKQEKIPGHGHSDSVQRAVDWFLTTEAKE